MVLQKGSHELVAIHPQKGWVLPIVMGRQRDSASVPRLKVVQTLRFLFALALRMLVLPLELQKGLVSVLRLKAVQRLRRLQAVSWFRRLELSPRRDSAFALKLKAGQKLLLMAGQMLEARIRTDLASVQELMVGQMLLLEMVHQMLAPQLADPVRRKDSKTEQAGKNLGC
jgi:hypothetical protein